MKRIILFSCIFLVISAYGQEVSLSITVSKTTSLVFPFPVTHVDCGSKDILVQQVKELDNILLVKAASPKFAESNLTVITNEGTVYDFRVNYEDSPGIFVLRIAPKHDANVQTYAKNIMDNPRTMHGVRDAGFEMFADLVGIYIRGETIYYQLQVYNRSTIDYDIDYIHFSIRDKKKMKRTAFQEIELAPISTTGNTALIKANSRNTIVVALPKFTIPDAKYLSIQIGEKNGGRHLNMRVHNRNILKAIPLPGSNEGGD